MGLSEILDEKNAALLAAKNCGVTFVKTLGKREQSIMLLKSRCSVKELIVNKTFWETDFGRNFGAQEDSNLHVRKYTST